MITHDMQCEGTRVRLPLTFVRATFSKKSNKLFSNRRKFESFEIEKYECQIFLGINFLTCGRSDFCRCQYEVRIECACESSLWSSCLLPACIPPVWMMVAMHPPMKRLTVLAGQSVHCLGQSRTEEEP